ncbi:MAG: hypothetical protein ABIL09_04050 [Gemmatimonadota bacterium]
METAAIVTQLVVALAAMVAIWRRVLVRAQGLGLAAGRSAPARA